MNWNDEDWREESNQWTRTWRAGDKDESIRIVHALYRLTGGPPMIDLGCRSAQLTRRLEGTWVEVDPQPDTPTGAVIMDLRRAPLEFAGETFNLMILTDVIEHLERKDAITLLREMKPLASGYLIFTPTGLLDPFQSDGPHAHRSGWTPEEFFQNGYTVWEWPIFHHFPGGAIRGAFWAWKLKERQLSVEEVATNSRVNL
jgi:hypothetical protein